MRKSIVLLVIALLCACATFARTDSVAPAPAVQTVTITQQQFDSLISAASRSNQIELIAKQEAERMFDVYTTHVSWTIGLFGVLVALFGAALPYFVNRSYEKKFNEKINAHERDIETSKLQINESAKAFSEFAKETENSLNKIVYDLDSNIAKISVDIKDHKRYITASKTVLEDLNKKQEDYENQLQNAKNNIKSIEEEIVLQANKVLASALFSQAQAEQDIFNKIRLYSSAIGAYPEYKSAYVERGHLYRKIEKYEEALKDFEKARELDPKDGIVYMILSSVYRRVGETDKADEAWFKMKEVGIPKKKLNDDPLWLEEEFYRLREAFKEAFNKQSGRE